MPIKQYKANQKYNDFCGDNSDTKAKTSQIAG
jgi:hypothetical protein